MIFPGEQTLQILLPYGIYVCSSSLPKVSPFILYSLEFIIEEYFEEECSVTIFLWLLFGGHCLPLAFTCEQKLTGNNIFDITFSLSELLRHYSK